MNAMRLSSIWCSPPRRRLARHGATMVELAIVLPIFLILVFGMLDLSIAVFRWHMLANAAREGARKAIVHGAMAPESWGPAPITTTADQTTAHPIVPILQPFLVGNELADVTIVVEWPEGSNALEKPVRVTLRSPYRPVAGFIFGGTPFNLEGSSTMLIMY